MDRLCRHWIASGLRAEYRPSGQDDQFSNLAFARTNRLMGPVSLHDRLSNYLRTIVLGFKVHALASKVAALDAWCPLINVGRQNTEDVGTFFKPIHLIEQFVEQHLRRGLYDEKGW